MISLIRTTEFDNWIKSLRDERAIARIHIRIERLVVGYFGDVKPVGEGVTEMRIDYGPGYRVYFARKGAVTVLLLCGGDKGSQTRDIRKSKILLREWSEK